MNSTKIKFCVPLLFCLLLSVHGLCSAAETPQTIGASREQIEEMRQHLNALESNNNELRVLLTTLGEDLIEASEQSQSLNSQIQLLKKQSQEQRTTIMVLREQLTGLKTDSQELSASLTIANAELQLARQYFQKTEKALKQEKKKNKILLTIAGIFAAVAVGSAM